MRNHARRRQLRLLEGLRQPQSHARLACAQRNASLTRATERASSGTCGSLVAASRRTRGTPRCRPAPAARSSRRSSASGSGKYISTSRPMIASKRASVARSCRSCVTKLTLARPDVGGAPLRERDRLGRAVDADHRAVAAHQRRRQERHVAGAAADVEHAHARPHAGRAQHFLRQLAEEPALSDQTLQLIVIVAEGVIVRGTVVSSAQVSLGPVSVVSCRAPRSCADFGQLTLVRRSGAGLSPPTRSAPWRGRRRRSRGPSSSAPGPCAGPSRSASNPAAKSSPRTACRRCRSRA